MALLFLQNSNGLVLPIKTGAVGNPGGGDPDPDPDPDPSADSFTLTATARTSAGVFDASGNLLRTLWSNVEYTAGTHAIEWDGLDDEERPVTGHEFRVISHDVQVQWDGVIGNTSEPVEESRKDLIHALVTPQDYEFVRSGAHEGMGHIGVGYNEGPAPVFQIAQDDYLKKSNRSIGDYRVSIQALASNSTHTYVLNVGTTAKKLFFVAAYENSQTDKNYATLANAVTAIYDNGDERANTIDPTVFAEFPEVPRGIAVQESGGHLITSFPQQDKIRIYQTDGLFLQEVAATSPGRMATNPVDDSIWIIAGAEGARALYRIDDLGGTPSFVEMVSGLDAPLDFDFSPDGATIAVLDGGAQQRVRYFSTTDYSAAGTYGQLGGHLTNGPEVTPDKFLLFDYTYAFEEKGFLCYSPDGKLWIGDMGNFRTVILDAAGAFLDVSQYIPRCYVTAADLGDSERVFANWLEFSVDYTQPLATGWAHTRNWIGGFAALDNGFAGVSSGLHTVLTLEHSGTTKTLAVANVAGLGEWELAIVILDDASGQIVDTGTRISSSSQALYSGGAIRRRDNTDNVQTIQESAFTGWDAEGMPTWGPEQIVATPPKGDRDPFIKGNTFSSRSGQRFPRTDSGKLVFLDASRRDINVNPGWHLGAVSAGESAWAWRASPSGQFTITGDVENPPAELLSGSILHGPGYCTGVYEDVRDHQYGGNRVVACGDLIAYGYHGEFWRGGQASQFIFWDDSGLFLVQCGQPSYPWRNLSSSYPGTSGNAFSPDLVRGPDGDYYLYHNDESVNGGIHRWRITGMDTLQIIAISISN